MQSRCSVLGLNMSVHSLERFVQVRLVLQPPQAVQSGHKLPLHGHLRVRWAVRSGCAFMRSWTAWLRRAWMVGYSSLFRPARASSWSRCHVKLHRGSIGLPFRNRILFVLLQDGSFGRAQLCSVLSSALLSSLPRSLASHHCCSYFLVIFVFFSLSVSI